jgi:hypothetical protein
MVLENSLMQKEKYMKEIGYMTKPKVMVFILTLMELNMRVSGGWTYNTVEAKNNGLMAQCLKGIIIRVKSVE